MPASFKQHFLFIMEIKIKKNNFVAFAVAFFALLLTSQITNAQFDPYLPEPIGWDGDPAVSYELLESPSCLSGFGGSGPYKVVIPLSSTCSLEVWYCWRTYNYWDGHHDNDLWISEYRIIDNCNGCCLEFINAMDNDPTYYLQRAWEYIVLVEQPWTDKNIPQCPEQSAQFWRLGMAACFSQNWILVWVQDDPQNPAGGLGHFEYVKKPCFIGEGDPFYSGWSCWQRFTICQKWVNGKPEIEISNVENVGGTINCGPGCKYICE
jgi:hypothetical protein